MRQEAAAAEAQASVTKGEIVALIPALRAFARSLCRNHADADDLVQETLTKAIANLHRFTPGTRLKSWLFTIMRNAFCARLAKDRRRPPAKVDCDEPDASASPQEWRAHFTDFREALRRLPPQQREALLLVGMLGESYEDAAAICGCAVGTIKSRVNRARAALIRQMGGSFAAAAPARSRQSETTD
ncbi:MAG: sigma-70 family RNA polymerase sigma factor [Amaricoccus sp.]